MNETQIKALFQNQFGILDGATYSGEAVTLASGELVRPRITMDGTLDGWEVVRGSSVIGQVAFKGIIPRDNPGRQANANQLVQIVGA